MAAVADHALLSVAAMARADALAIAGGVPGITLMENAGAGVVAAICERWPCRPVVVLCGPGNNGGDGFVVARRLREAGWPVRLALIGGAGAVTGLTGDAARAAARWTGPISPLAAVMCEPDWLQSGSLVVDALFGAGLSRPVSAEVGAVIAAVAAAQLSVVAVDVPSGVHGDSGRVLGAAFRAEMTVTFFRRKPGHLLLPGRSHCGVVRVVDIGIPQSVLEQVPAVAVANHPGLWALDYPWPTLGGHKFSRGHALIAGGARMTGAARLAARAALRVGAGLVTVACPPEVHPIYAGALEAVLVESVAENRAFAALLADSRRNAVLLGPGCGVSQALRERVLLTLAAGRPTVLDADALTVFAPLPETLFNALSPHCLLTPHEGEFGRLFGADRGDRDGDKVERVRQAAARSRAVVLLKGADTVIAAPDGRVAINENAPPDLATAGSGDVLAGFAVGLIAQGMETFAAAAAAAWLHGAAAAAFGPGLIAEDLPGVLPKVLADLKRRRV